jgi:hypothetical protein
MTSVAGAFGKAAVAEGVEARVLVGDRRNEKFDHVVFDGLGDPVNGLFSRAARLSSTD